jgi:hypothetical protein
MRKPYKAGCLSGLLKHPETLLKHDDIGKFSGHFVSPVTFFPIMPNV